MAQLDPRTRGLDPALTSAGPRKLHKRPPASRGDGVRAKSALPPPNPPIASLPPPTSRAPGALRSTAARGRPGPAPRPQGTDAFPDAQSLAGSGTPTRRQNQQSTCRSRGENMPQARPVALRHAAAGAAGFGWRAGGRGRGRLRAVAPGPGASPPSEGGDTGTPAPETDLGVSVAQSHRGRGCGGQSVRRGGRGPAGSTPRAEGEAWLRNGRARRAACLLRSAESSGGEARAPAPRERPAAHTLPPPPASAPAGHWEEPKPVRQDSGAAAPPTPHTHTDTHTDGCRTARFRRWGFPRPFPPPGPPSRRGPLPAEEARPGPRPARPREEGPAAPGLAPNPRPRLRASRPDTRPRAPGGAVGGARLTPAAKASLGRRPKLQSPCSSSARLQLPTTVGLAARSWIL